MCDNTFQLKTPDTYLFKKRRQLFPNLVMEDKVVSDTEGDKVNKSLEIKGTVITEATLVGTLDNVSYDINETLLIFKEAILYDSKNDRKNLCLSIGVNSNIHIGKIFDKHVGLVFHCTVKMCDANKFSLIRLSIPSLNIGSLEEICASYFTDRMFENIFSHDVGGMDTGLNLVELLKCKNESVKEEIGMIKNILHKIYVKQRHGGDSSKCNDVKLVIPKSLNDIIFDI